jgi:hypothetical protein
MAAIVLRSCVRANPPVETLRLMLARVAAAQNLALHSRALTTKQQNSLT